MEEALDLSSDRLLDDDSIFLSSVSSKRRRTPIDVALHPRSLDLQKNTVET